ncbi:MAG TPA: hypothetical protein VHP81_06980 [Lachnospiraceae bacterium]|nr:hypothetical protein [Lachnospiraceae bacterium]
MNKVTKSNLSSVYWLGGSTCAGKSTISSILSETYGFTVYHCDEHLWKHIEKSNTKEHPHLSKGALLSLDDILGMSEDEYLSWIIDLHTEEYSMILDDLDKLSAEKPILVEGVNLLPKLIKNEIVNSNNAIWLVADEEFYKTHQMQRNEMFDRVNKCSNPEQALHSYMNFDLAYGKYIRKEANRLELEVLVVEKDCDMMKNVRLISSHFRLNY